MYIRTSSSTHSSSSVKNAASSAGSSSPALCMAPNEAATCVRGASGRASITFGTAMPTSIRPSDSSDLPSLA